MNEEKRILHVFGRMDRGGAEIRTLELFSQLAHAGIRFDFATMSDQKGDLDSEIRALGGKLYPFTPSPGFLIHFWQLLRRERFSGVHSHLHLFSGLILLIAQLAGVPQRIAHFRSTGDGKAKTRLRRIRNWLLLQLILKTTTHGIGVSKASLDLAVGATWRTDPRFQVIYSGVTLQRFQAKEDRNGLLREFSFEPTSRVVIHVGRMAREKNHLQLINIFAELERLDPRVRLLLVGRRDQAIQSAIESRAAELDLSSKIKLAGMRTDVPRLMASSDLMIFPSLREGLPGAVVEAAAAGLPVLASRIPGIEELEGKLNNLHLESPHATAGNWALKAKAMMEAKNPPLEIPARLPGWLDSSECAHKFALLYGCTAEQKSLNSECEKSAHD